MNKINLDSINSMDGFAFEDMISELLKKMGFVVEQTKKTADGGIDINAYSDKPIISGRYIIQCKRSSSPISESVIRDLYGVITAETANKGILITNSKFSSASLTFAEGKPIELIDGDKLVGLIIEYLDFLRDGEVIKIPVHQELLYKAIVKNLKNLKQKYDQIGKGQVFKSKRIIQKIETYNNFFSNKNNDMQQFIEVLQNLADSFNENPPENVSDVAQFVKARVENFKTLTERFFSGWEDMYFTKSPEEFEEIHEIMLRIYDSIFTSLFSWMNTLKDALNNPKKYETAEHQAVLTFVLDEDGIAQYCQEITSKFEEIRLQVESKSQEASQCYIATVCFSPLSEEVMLLREFRDKHLANNSFGKMLIKKYYKFGPQIARYTEKHRVIKAVSKSLLRIIIYAVGRFCKG